MSKGWQYSVGRSLLKLGALGVVLAVGGPGILLAQTGGYGSHAPYPGFPAYATGHLPYPPPWVGHPGMGHAAVPGSYGHYPPAKGLPSGPAPAEAAWPSPPEWVTSVAKPPRPDPGPVLPVSGVGELEYPPDFAAHHHPHVAPHLPLHAHPMPAHRPPPPPVLPPPVFPLREQEPEHPLLAELFCVFDPNFWQAIRHHLAEVRITPWNEPHTYLETSMLLYRVRPQNLPIPLVTLGSPTDPIPGALGQPGTQVLVGNQAFEYGTFTGGRLRLGRWLGCNECFGLEVGAFLLEERSTGVSAGPEIAGSSVLAFSVFRPELGREGTFLISDPVRVLAGNVDIRTSSQFWGADALGMMQLHRTGLCSVDFLAGFRYLHLEEDFTISAALLDPVLGVTDDFVDRFAARNQFFGGNIGGRVAFHLGRWMLDVRGTLGLGSTYQVVKISGQTVQSLVGVPDVGVFPGGLFALPTNIGVHTRNQFSIVPEVRAKVLWELTSSIRLFGSYDFIYWTQVVRPAEQIDRNVNRTQRGGGILTGPAQPAALMRSTDFWTHGLSFGVEWVF